METLIRLQSLIKFNPEIGWSAAVIIWWLSFPKGVLLHILASYHQKLIFGIVWSSELISYFGMMSHYTRLMSPENHHLVVRWWTFRTLRQQQQTWNQRKHTTYTFVNTGLQQDRRKPATSKNSKQGVSFHNISSRIPNAWILVGPSYRSVIPVLGHWSWQRLYEAVRSLCKDNWGYQIDQERYFRAAGNIPQEEQDSTKDFADYQRPRSKICNCFVGFFLCAGSFMNTSLDG